MKEEITLDDILWQLEKHPIDGDYLFGCKEVKIIYDSIIKLKQENKQLKEDLKTLWIALWNNDTKMTSYQSEIFDKYYDEFHKKG